MDLTTILSTIIIDGHVVTNTEIIIALLVIIIFILLFTRPWSRW